MKNLIKKLFGILTLSLAFNYQVNAQDTTAQKTSDNKWSFLIEPYLMFPNMNGNLGVSNLPEVSLAASPEDIFSKLQIGAMLFMEARTDKWAVNSDIIYMDLSMDAESGNVINSGEANAIQFALEIAGLRRVLPWLEVGVAGLVNAIESDLTLVTNNIGPGSGTTTRTAAISETWVDPMIVARIKSNSGKKFIYEFRGEIGGFGIGSDLAWQAHVTGGYRVSKLFQVTAGYRAISLDYTSGSGKDTFKYDVVTFGPELRFGFNF